MAAVAAALSFVSVRGGSASAEVVYTAPVTAPAESAAAADSVAVRSRLFAAAAASGLRPEVLELGLRAHARVAAAGLLERPLLTVVDFSRLSREKRLWVLDVENGTVLAHELVAHGKNSGGDQATKFSNVVGSNQSSIGTFVTTATYHGKHGRSLRLKGLDRGVNDRAEARAIVIHGADYVNEGIVKQLGRLGRSQGCPALSRASAQRVIDLIRDGTTFFAYHPSGA